MDTTLINWLLAGYRQSTAANEQTLDGFVAFAQSVLNNVPPEVLVRLPNGWSLRLANGNTYGLSQGVTPLDPAYLPIGQRAPAEETAAPAAPAPPPLPLDPAYLPINQRPAAATGQFVNFSRDTRNRPDRTR